jgi:hypothetical protein
MARWGRRRCSKEFIFLPALPDHHLHHFFPFFSAFFLLAFFPALHITPVFILFLFSFIFLPQPVEEADENVSPFPSFWLKNKEKDSLRAHSIIRPQSAQPHSFLRLLSFSSRGPQHPTRHR